jgi:hypothetical protein
MFLILMPWTKVVIDRLKEDVLVHLADLKIVQELSVAHL